MPYDAIQDEKGGTGGDGQMIMETEPLTADVTNTKISSEPPQWVELRHPKTNRFIGKYCPQSHQLLVIERGQRGLIELPKA